MGSASSRKKAKKLNTKTVKLESTRSETRYVKIQEDVQVSFKETNKRKKSVSSEPKGKQRDRSHTHANVTPLGGYVGGKKVLRSKSEPGDALSKLNKSLSTSLRLSDFCKIYRKECLDTDESNPIFIPYKASFENQNGESLDLCHVCSVYTGSVTYTCAVCCRVYHESCLVKIGQCESEAAQYLHQSVPDSGWSCHLCDNVSNLLTNDEFTVLLDMFRVCTLTLEKDLSQEQYLAYRKWHYKKQLGAEMTLQAIQEEQGVIKLLCSTASGHISWKTFINHEALKILDERNENALVRLLTESEINMARKMVQMRETSDQGDITRHNFVNLTSKFEHVFRVTYKKEKILFADDDVDGTVTWDRFLREMAIYLIAGRLNVFRQEVANAKKCADAELSAKPEAPKCVSTVTIMTRPQPRKGTSRSLYMNNTACGRLVGEAQVMKRPLSFA